MEPSSPGALLGRVSAKPRRGPSISCLNMTKCSELTRIFWGGVHKQKQMDLALARLKLLSLSLPTPVSLSSFLLYLLSFGKICQNRLPPVYPFGVIFSLGQKFRVQHTKASTLNETELVFEVRLDYKFCSAVSVPLGVFFGNWGPPERKVQGPFLQIILADASFVLAKSAPKRHSPLLKRQTENQKATKAEAGL